MSTANGNRSDNCAKGFDAIIGQQRQIHMLAAALQKNEVPHAMLFTGEAGVGKKTTAINFSKACNCERPMPLAGGAAFSGRLNPCGTCRPCRKIDSFSHPDFHYIKPPGATIRIEQIRALCSALALRPNEASLRIVVISDAHLLNAEAGNALLKILEEPPDKTVMILTAPEAADLLPTIVSRCRHFRFNPIPEDRLEAYLIETRGIPGEKAMVIASLAGGSIGRALSMEGDTSIMDLRRRVIEWMEILFKNPSGNDLYFSEAIAADKITLGLSLDIMKSWVRDLAIAKHTPEKIYNRDYRERLLALSEQADPDGLIEKADAVWQAERALKTNANPRLAVEAMVMKFSG